MDDHTTMPGGDFGAPPAVPQAREERLTPRFTGDGKEYFRIWIVNLLLIVATLGVYSAWAKVRRLQYFDRNTWLGDAVFDFRGRPMAILRGRIVALLMLVAYHYAFGFSAAVTLAILGALGLALPFLLRGALRFRLQNTFYRGLPFAFTGSREGAYGVFVPIMAMVVGPALMLAISPTSRLAPALGLLYLAFPYLYGRLKSYQHGHVAFGGAQSTFSMSPWRFYRFYFVAIGCWLLIAVVVGISAAIMMPRLNIHAASHPWLLPLIAFGGIGATYLVFLLVIPYMAVRTGNLVWSSTAFPGVSIASTMSARAFARLQIVNVLLTVLTLGLFRPFAVVRVHRFRLAAMTVTASAGFEGTFALAAVSRQTDGATGDGAADFFGFDLSL